MIPCMAAVATQRAILAGLAAVTAMLSCSPAALAAKPNPPSPAQATNALGFDLMRKLPPGNLVFSPDSIAAALAMVGEGAAGTTAGQIVRVLHLGSPADFGELGGLQQTISTEQAGAARGDPEPPTLSIANGLFLQKGFLVRPSFLASLQRGFAAQLQIVNFMQQPIAAVRSINEWVNIHTEGAIPTLLEHVSPMARLLLANAVHLHADWANPFPTENTSAHPFHGPSGLTSVPFMAEEKALGYARGDNYRAIDLPYRSSTLSLMVVLPEHEDLASLQRRMSPDMLSEIVRRLRTQLVALSLPKFQIAAQESLNGPLSLLGMSDAFSPRANFSRVDSRVALSISRVLHSADIQVDEQGTVASAVTATEFFALGPRPIAKVRFDANRPFLFFLLDDRTGTVLFAGRLEDAASAQG
jgi:serpin B